MINLKMVKMQSVLKVIGLTLILLAYLNIKAQKTTDDTSSKFAISSDIILGAEHFESFYSFDAIDSEKNIFLRRAKLAIEYQLSDNWQYTVDLTLKNDEGNIEFDLGDSYINFTGIDDLEIKLGHQKEPFGFERLTGLTKQINNERSSVSDSFAPGRNYGIAIAHKQKHLTWSIGYFQEKLDDSPTKAFTGRVTYAPMVKKEKVIHIGVAASYRDYQSNIFQIRNRAGLYSVDNIIRSAAFNAKKSVLLGTELFVSYGSLALSAEYMAETVDQDNGNQWDFSGYYLQASYFLTGDKLRYKHGKLKSNKLTETSGAWQLVARYSDTDLRDNNLGTSTQVGLIGVNYYWNEDFILKHGISLNNV